MLSRSLVLFAAIAFAAAANVRSTLTSRALAGTPPTKDDGGKCPADATLCDTGGCCAQGTFCQATDEEGTVFVCLSDKDIPGSTPTVAPTH
ncbi:hypothetical protein EXIGLDRAFT_768522, partial [Exidia glandulosa HHB12029]